MNQALSSIGGSDHFSSSTSGLGPAWCVTPGQTLRHRSWQGEVVIYNDLTGDTHLLTESALHLLRLLQHGPVGEDALATGLRAEFEGEDGEIDDASVAQLLAELRALALIEPIA